MVNPEGKEPRVLWSPFHSFTRRLEPLIIDAAGKERKESGGPCPGFLLILMMHGPEVSLPGEPHSGGEKRRKKNPECG